MPLPRFSSRYNDYVPLGHQASKRFGPGHILAAFLTVSVVLNCVFVFRSWTTINSCKHTSCSLTEPAERICLRRKHYPLLSQVPDLHTQPLANSSRGNAIVTTLYNDAYAAAVATLGHSLRKVNTTARMVVLYFPDKVSPDALCLATSSGFTAQSVERIAPPDNGRGMNPHFIDQYTKLSLWTLDTSPEPITTAVYLGSDTLVLQNFDELFSLPYNFAAVPDVWFTTSFNAGVMLLRPDLRLYHQMLESLSVARYPHEYAEQAFLNQFFATDVLRLPFAYNGNIALKDRSPGTWDGIKDEMRIIHYTITKPFISHSWKAVSSERLEERIEAASREHGGLFREEMMQWGRMWKETQALYAAEQRQCVTWIDN